MQQKKVLIAPLDWGLGHATRCIPVITAFIELGYHVTIATEGAHEIILREAFPSLTFLRLKGYQIRYSKKADGFTLIMVLKLLIVYLKYQLILIMIKMKMILNVN